MTKGTEYPSLLMERVVRRCSCGHMTVIAWVPCDSFTAERISERYPVGAQVSFRPWEPRNESRLRLYWAILHECVANTDNKYGRAEDLHSALKVSLGYTREIKLLNVGKTSSLLMALGVALNKIRLVVENTDRQSIVARLVRPLINQAFAIAEQIGGSITDTIILPGSIALDKMDEGEFRIFFDRAMNELRKAGYPIDEIMEVSHEKIAKLKARQTPVRYGDQNNGRGETPPRADRGIEETESRQATA